MAPYSLQREAAAAGAAPLPREADGARTEAPRPPARDDVCVLLLAHVAPRWRAWGWGRIAAGALPWRHEPGLLFAKALGSGHHGGFGLRPSTSRQGLFAAFADEDAATAFATRSPLVARHRERSDEFALLILRATSCRGTWSGQRITPTRAAPAAGAGPVAALTRASIRPLKAWRFWRHSPPAERDVQRAAGCRLAVGLGEAPLVRQATFSVWENQAAMDAYARSGAHLQAARAAAEGGFFSESLFARFVLLHAQGRWHGTALDHG